MNGIIMLTVMVAALGLPVTMAVAAVVWEKYQRRRAGRRSPLTDKLVHLPGEQLRQRMDTLGNKIEEHIVQLLMIGPAALLVVLLPRVRWENLRLSWIDWLVLAFAIGFCCWNVKRLIPLWRQRRSYRDGMRAEIAVAQQLDRLRESGCTVFHDLPAGKDFNIDHVVIGPSTVFMVETKSRRKVGEGKASATVDYDGKALQFPGWAERKPLEQARAQARWLTDYLRGETGEATAVIPVVCLPGWFVQATKESHASDVRVINPKMTSMFIDAGSRPHLQQSQRNRISNALQKRYPELDLADQD
jgi:hypothetical protein